VIFPDIILRGRYFSTVGKYIRAAVTEEAALWQVKKRRNHTCNGREPL
jgi:hypothetical protein